LDEQLAQSRARGINTPTLLEALDAGESLAAVSALAVAPYVRTNDPDVIVTLGRAMAPLVARQDAVTLCLCGDLTLPLVVGQQAATQLVKLFVRHGEAIGDQKGDIACAALEAGLATGLESRLAPPVSLALFLSGLGRTSPALMPVLHRRIGEIFRDSELSDASRFMAYLLQPRGVLRRAAAELLCDGTTSAGLRALIGGVLLNLDPGALDDRLDRNCSPWQSEQVLPVSMPVDEVPWAWLVNAFAVGRHKTLLHRIVAGVMDRLVAEDGLEEQLSQIVPVLVELGRADVIRQLVDDAEPLALGRTAAARWLALLGRGEDEYRLASYMVRYSLWFPRGQVPADPGQPGGLQPSRSVADGATNALEPFIVAGFGPRQAQRIMSKAYAYIARDHVLHRRIQLARRAAREALACDALNLDAYRLATTLTTK
jgi:hypothetical protein